MVYIICALVCFDKRKNYLFLFINPEILIRMT